MYVSQDKPCYLNQLIQRTINLPKSITYPIPTSLPLKLTLILEPISPLRFSSKSSFSDDKNYCDGQISFLSNKNSGPCHHNKQKFRSVPPQQTKIPVRATITNKTSGPCHHNKQKFRSVPQQQTKISVRATTTNKNSGPCHHNKQLLNLPTEHSLVQISAGFKGVGTKPQISTTNFSYIVSTLFWAQIFHSLPLCRIHHNAVCESVQQKIFFEETFFSTANSTGTINLLNNKQAIDSNRGIDNSFTGTSLHLFMHNLTEFPCSQLTRKNTQTPYALPELSLNPCNSTSRTSQQKTRKPELP